MPRGPWGILHTLHQFFIHCKQPDPAGLTPSISEATWVDNIGFVCPNLLKIPRKDLLCEVGFIQTFSTPSLYIANIPPAANTYVGISQKRLSLKERVLPRLCTCLRPISCLCILMPDFVHASVDLPLAYFMPVILDSFWLVPFSAYNQLCTQWAAPAKWPFVGTIRHLHHQTSCKHLIVSACSHLWVQLLEIQVCLVLCTI